MTNTNKKTMKKKLISAIAMLTVSAVTLSTATYAWFTMNKEVSVVGMQVKAHAEEGLLINEVATANSPTWDEQATGGWTEAIALRPASTKDLTNWWHANSKKSYSEAGASGTVVDTVNTVQLGSGTYYLDIKSIPTETVKTAVQGESAETIVHYQDAYFGSGTGYNNGEGFYVMYKYYLKSSKSDAGTYDIKGNNFMVKVTATKKNSDNSGTTNNLDLDKAIRVGVKVDNSFKIFAPLYNADQTYNVAASASTIESESLTAYKGNNWVAIDGASVTIDLPNVVTNGKEADVYIWFEGEDPNCKSDNLSAVLDSYEIRVDFKDAGLENFSSGS